LRSENCTFCKKWAFQLEAGNNTGYEHYQCRISLKTKLREQPVRDLFADVKAHVSRTSTANSTNTFYILKSETRMSGPWTDEDKYIPSHLREEREWFDWQQDIVDKVETKAENDGKIICIIDKVGGRGKTTVCQWLSVRGKLRIIPPMNDFKDVMRMVCDTPVCGAYGIDMPRAMDKRKLSGFYAAIETIKGGYAFDERYSFKDKHFEIPHVFVFTNTEPDYSLLTARRWKVVDITDYEIYEEPTYELDYFN